jgi:hypothetical protein
MLRDPPKIGSRPTSLGNAGVGYLASNGRMTVWTMNWQRYGRKRSWPISVRDNRYPDQNWKPGSPEQEASVVGPQINHPITGVYRETCDTYNIWRYSLYKPIIRHSEKLLHLLTKATWWFSGAVLWFQTWMLRKPLLLGWVGRAMAELFLARSSDTERWTYKPQTECFTEQMTQPASQTNSCPSLAYFSSRAILFFLWRRNVCILVKNKIMKGGDHVWDLRLENRYNIKTDHKEIGYDVHWILTAQDKNQPAGSWAHSNQPSSSIKPGNLFSIEWLLKGKVIPRLWLIKHQALKTNGGVEVPVHRS